MTIEPNQLGLWPGEPAEAFLRAVLHTGPTFISRVDADYALRYINRLPPGVEFDAVMGADVLSFIEPEYRDVARRCFEGVQESRQPDSYLSLGLGPDGKTATYHNHVSAIADGDGRTGLCIVAVDVTEERLQQAALQTSEGKLDLAVKGTGLALWSWDIGANQVQWNERMYEITGQPTPVDLSDYMEQVVHPDDREQVEARSAQIMQTGRMEAQQHRILRPDGTVRWILNMGAVETNDQGVPVRIVGGMLDITERKVMEERLKETDRRQSLAHLTAAVAHNFNNMLMVMMPTLELLQDVVPPDNREDIIHALSAARRSADMVRQLMTISGTEHDNEGTASTNLPELVAGVVSMARQVLPLQLSITTRLQDGLPPVAIPSMDLEQVLLNLILNARDAVENTEAPRIQIEVSQAPPDAASTAPRIRLTVSDNGVGMTGEVRRSVFEPFFTTKRSLGNGLGLSSAHALVTRAGGEIRCESTLGEGARFILDISAATETEAVQATPARAPSLTSSRILIVDDEDAVRRVVRRMLEAEGHVIVDASSVDDAEALLHGEQGPAPDVVLLDRTMPDRGGLELLPALAVRAPQAKVLLFSGDPGTPPTGVDGVVRKPVEIESLIEQIVRVRRG